MRNESARTTNGISDYSAALGKPASSVAAPPEERAGEARCAEATGSEIFLAATITGSNEQKGSEMPAEGKGERQSAGTVSGGSAQAPTISDQKQGTPAGLLPNDPSSATR